MPKSRSGFGNAVSQTEKCSHGRVFTCVTLSNLNEMMVTDIEFYHEYPSLSICGGRGQNFHRTKFPRGKKVRLSDKISKKRIKFPKSGQNFRFCHTKLFSMKSY